MSNAHRGAAMLSVPLHSTTCNNESLSDTDCSLGTALSDSKTVDKRACFGAEVERTQAAVSVAGWVNCSMEVKE